MLGHCSKVYEEKLGDCMSICGNRQIVDDHMFFEGCSHSTACSIILRGANDFMMDEMERSLHDALCIVSKVLESKTLVCCLSTPLLSRVCRSSVAAALSLLCLSISANSLQLSKPTSNWLSRLLLTLCCHPQDSGCECGQGCQRPHCQVVLLPPHVSGRH